MVDDTGDSDLGFKVWGFRFRALSINDPEPKTNSEISEGFLRSAGPWMLCKPVYAKTNRASAGNGGMGHVANKWAYYIYVKFAISSFLTSPAEVEIP